MHMRLAQAVAQRLRRHNQLEGAIEPRDRERLSYLMRQLINALAPTNFAFTNPEVLHKVMAHTPLSRLPEVEDIAAAIVYLCSPAARCITGITLPVDSGYLAR